MAKLDLEELTKKHLNTVAKIKKIPRNKDNYIIDLIGIFKYIDKITKNSTSGGAINDFLIENSLVDKDQQAVLTELEKTYHSYYSYSVELEKIFQKIEYKKQRAGMTARDHLKELSDEVNEDLTHKVKDGTIFGAVCIGIMLIFFFSCVNNMPSSESGPCAKLGMKSNFNNTGCN